MVEERSGIAEVASDRSMALSAVQSLMGRVFGVPPETITEATGPAQIEAWDSLNMAIIAIGLERRLDRAVPVEFCLRAASVADLLDAICMR